MNRRLLCAVAALCAGAATVWAWSAEGHRAGADIAKGQLKESNPFAAVATPNRASRCAARTVYFGPHACWLEVGS